jgi:hypothetical protein
MTEMEPYDASTTPDEPAPEADSPLAEPVAGQSPAEAGNESGTPARADERANMLPRRGRRRLGVERLLVRLIATAGIIGIGVALGAILVSQKVTGWIDGLVIAGVTVILSAILWSSRQL